jgi:hypothetical protein
VTASSTAARARKTAAGGLQRAEMAVRVVQVQGLEPMVMQATYGPPAPCRILPALSRAPWPSFASRSLLLILISCPATLNPDPCRFTPMHHLMSMVALEQLLPIAVMATALRPGPCRHRGISLADTHASYSRGIDSHLTQDFAVASRTELPPMAEQDTNAFATNIRVTGCRPPGSDAPKGCVDRAGRGSRHLGRDKSP